MRNPASLASTSPRAEETPQQIPLTWQDIAGETVFDQAKSVLAVIGALAVIYLLLKPFGG